MDFTNEQKEAVKTVEGNVCCIASAGSGKTVAFTTRIAYMLKELDVKAENIMAITFTTKASEEMIKRLNKMVGNESVNGITIGTTHSVFYKLLKSNDKDISKLKIAPDWWRFSLMNDMCLDKSGNNPNGLGLGAYGLRASELGSFISHQKNSLIGHLDDVVIDEKVEFAKSVPRELLQQAYIKYEILKDNSRQIDFDDILKITYDKALEDESFRSKLSNQFKYIMIDEYQDTSFVVKEALKLINNKNVFAVGDFRQSIYGFINAKIENILNFEKDFQGAKIIELNKNFRSTQSIVGLSNRIISNSPIEAYQNYKPSESVSGVGEEVDFSIYLNEYVQAEQISDKIHELKEDGHQLSEIAILLRTNSQTSTLEDVFAQQDIPYEVNKSSSFFDRREIVDILSYAKLALDTEDDESLRRIYNTPNRYLSKKFIHELESFASKEDISLYYAMEITPHNKEWKYKSNIDKVRKIVDDLSSRTNENAGKFIRTIINKVKYEAHIESVSTTPSSLNERLDSLDRLCEMASKFPSVKAFLAHVVTIKDKQNKSIGKDAVQLVTMHSSKGLEWDTVFVVNVNDNVIPHEMSGLNYAGIEEERRVLYVACSRARSSLSISWVAYDNEMSINKESRFVKELIEGEALTLRKKINSGERSASFKYNTLN